MYSLTLKGALVMALGFLFKAINVPFVPEDAEIFVGILLQAIGGIGILIGRYRQGDINLFGKKK